ncbi:hypothetical protein K488DRAFT_74651 [Vararia minispora EC-137]|uniref:Uncharacterized protein n=1 Tax=Vararia minispora EC-137 TaxID=1314806 RepID=A0ACB8Q6K0_9AGAM|nr:hypothetical protein K488DRAFT_74651 [Vararia minispora EC-137]
MAGCPREFVRSSECRSSRSEPRPKSRRRHIRLLSNKLLTVTQCRAEIDRAIRSALPLASHLQDFARRDSEPLRGVVQSPSLKTAYLVAIVQAIILQILPELTIKQVLHKYVRVFIDSFVRTSANIALPVHPMAHKNPLAQWLPKACPSSLLVLSYSPLQILSGHTASLAGNLNHSTCMNDGTPSSSDSDSNLGDSRDSTEISPESFWSRSAPDDDTLTDDSSDDQVSQTSLLAAPENSESHLALLCMADVNNIFHVMASAMHQRRALGLDGQPLVGLAFHPRGVCVQAFFSWFDDQDASEAYCMPLPRVAYVSCEPHPAQEAYGLYNLTDARSLHALASFFFCLRKDLLSLASLSAARIRLPPDPHSEKLYIWRADSSFPLTDDGLVIRHGIDDVTMREIHEDRLLSAVREWREGVYMSMDAARTGVSDTAPPGYDGDGGSRAEQVAQSVSDKQQPKSDTAYKEQREKFAAVHVRLTPTSVTISEPPQTEKRDASAMSIADNTSVKTGRSASSFAKNSTSIVHWMFDRHASSHSWCLEQDIEKTIHPSREIRRIHPKGVKQWVQEFRKHASAYEEKIVLFIPSSDHQSDAIGRLFEDRAAIAEQFFKPTSLDALRQRTEADRFTKCIDESDPVLEWLRSNFPRFLDVVTQVIALSPAGRNRKNHKVSESDWRHPWELITKEVLDALEIYASSENTTSKVDYLPAKCMPSGERIIRLPLIDQAFRGTRPGLAEPAVRDAISRLGEEFTMEAEVASQAECAIPISPSRRDRQKTWEVAAQEKMDKIRAKISHWVTSRKKGLMSIECAQPRSATCDGLLFIEIPDFYIGLSPGEVDLLDLFSTIRNSDSTKPVPSFANLASTCQDAFVGIFVNEFKTPEADPGLNQLRLYLTAMVKYLAVLGITDFPVYGVVTEGSVGRLVQAWGHKFTESDDTHVRIVDMHCAEFDLATVEGGLRYAYFLARLVHDDVPKLVKLVKARKDDVTKRVKAADGSLQWNMVQVHGWDDEREKTGENGGNDDGGGSYNDGAGAGIPVTEAALAHTRAATASSQE